MCRKPFADTQTVRLLVVASNFGQQLVGRDANGGGQLAFRPDSCFQFPGQWQGLEQGGVGVFCLALGREVDVTLVEGIVCLRVVNGVGTSIARELCCGRVYGYSAIPIRISASVLGLTIRYKLRRCVGRCSPCKGGRSTGRETPVF